jgi:signal transduction histidine kinase
LSVANRTPAATLVCGLSLAGAALAARTWPVAAGAVAWLACAWSLMSGWGVNLPEYLLVGVPLWGIARYSRRYWVITAAVAVGLGGVLAVGDSVTGGQVIVRLLPGLFAPWGWTLSLYTVDQVLFTAFAVWLIGAMFWGAGLFSRGLEASRASSNVAAASQARTAMLDAQNALAEERARISREMHDIVGHSLSVMIAQADGGRYAAATDPEAPVRALEAIAQTGRDALSDMRGIVRVLREGPEDETVQLKPTAHVKDIEQLVAEARTAGLNVTLVRVGKPRYLPPGVGATLHRITQEAFTNALKHAGPGVSVAVTERWEDDRIAITVSDDGRGAAALNDGAGHGLVGMRERAEMLGGAFQAGPGPTGGFRVWVSVPLPSRHQLPEFDTAPPRPPIRHKKGN